PAMAVLFREINRFGFDRFQDLADGFSNRPIPHGRIERFMGKGDVQQHSHGSPPAIDQYNLTHEHWWASHQCPRVTTLASAQRRRPGRVLTFLSRSRPLSSLRYVLSWAASSIRCSNCLIFLLSQPLAGPFLPG